MPIEQGESRLTESDSVLEQGGSEEKRISLLESLIVVAKQRRTLVKVTVALTVLAALVSLLVPNRYTATTVLLPPQQQQSLAATLASQLGGAAMLGAIAGKDMSLGLKNPSDMYVGMLKSRSVEEAIIQRFGLMAVYHAKRMSDARKSLQSATDILATKSGFITVSVEDKDRNRAAKIANGYVEELRQLTSTLAFTEAGQRRLFFEQQLRQAKDELADAEVALKQTEEKTGLIQIDSQSRAIIGSVASMRAQIAAHEVQLQAMRSFATDQNPDVILLKEQLVGLRIQLAELEKRQNVNSGSIQVPTAMIPEVGLEYVRRFRDVKYYEAIFELLAKQFEAAKLDEAREGAVIQVVDKAVEPDKKSSPNRILIVLAAALAGFIGSAFWALSVEALARAKQDPERGEQLARLKRALRRRS